MEMALTIILMLANNKGYLETNLNMGFFDIRNDVPIELIFKGEESKNVLGNVIFVLDGIILFL